MSATYGKIKHSDFVNIRETPGGTIIGRLYPNNPLMYYPDEDHIYKGNKWYRIKFDGDAYVMAKYVTEDNSDHAIVGTISYSPDAAETYAKNHTENTGAMTAPSNNNSSFGFTQSYNCTNFVSQCLCAGGLPMFNGWARNFTGIPSSWDKGSWTLTNRTRCSLLAKGFITEIPFDQVQKGDIIYNYKASNSVHLRYPHVVLAAGSYNASTKKVSVHGHTENRRYYQKSLTATNCKCYRVISSIPKQACDKPVTLPPTGSGATVN